MIHVIIDFTYLHVYTMGIVIILGLKMEVTGKISQWGNSLALRVNQKVADALSVKAGSVVSLYLDETTKALTIKNVEEKEAWPFKEADLLVGMNAENSHAELLAPLLESEID